MARKILVVDDEENIRKLYSAELVAEGYEVQVAGSAEAALEALKGEFPDLVVLDIKMDDAARLDVLGSVKEMRSDLPVVLNSAYSVYKNDFRSWLADAYVVKSSDMTELKTRIRELLTI